MHTGIIFLINLYFERLLDKQINFEKHNIIHRMKNRKNK